MQIWLTVHRVPSVSSPPEVRLIPHDPGPIINHSVDCLMCPKAQVNKDTPIRQEIPRFRGHLLGAEGRG